MASAFLAACSTGPGSGSGAITREVELQIGAAKDSTIPPGLTLLGSSGPTRDRQSVSAEWSFDAPTDWRPYIEQAEASLRRAGYQPGLASADERAFSKHVPGDAYRVRIAHDEATPRRVTVTFWAGPD